MELNSSIDLILHDLANQEAPVWAYRFSQPLFMITVERSRCVKVLWVA
jgi:hypothetical protein